MTVFDNLLNTKFLAAGVDTAVLVMYFLIGLSHLKNSFNPKHNLNRVVKVVVSFVKIDFRDCQYFHYGLSL